MDLNLTSEESNPATNCVRGSRRMCPPTGPSDARNRWSLASNICERGNASCSKPDGRSFVAQAIGGRGANLMQQVIFWQEMALASAPPMANTLGWV